MFLHSTAVDRVYLAQYTECLSFGKSFQAFELDSPISYQGYCDFATDESSEYFANVQSEAPPTRD
jgi:hypothetical protein